MTLKRSSLRRGSPLKRTALARGSASLTRTALAPVSAKRIAERPERDKVRAAVFARDGNACQVAPMVASVCFGPPTVHHLRKASAGGAYVEDNLITACAFHNDWIEDFPSEAKALGLVR